MKKSLQLLRIGFESSSTCTPEFLSFFRTFKSEITKELKLVGATDIKIYRGHFDLHGFFKVGEQMYYLSFGDVRGSEYKNRHEMLYRTAKHNKDWTGGGNQYIPLSNGMGYLMNL